MRAAACETPLYDAVTVTGTTSVTLGEAVTVKVAVFCPPGTTTLVGTRAAEESVDNETRAPAGGALPSNITTPVAD